MEKLVLLFCSVVLSISVSDGYKILAVFPLPSKSHGILGDSMVKHLINAGHEVHYITPFMKQTVPPNLHQVDVSQNSQLFNESSINVKAIIDGDTALRDSYVLFSMMTGMAHNTLRNPNVQNLMQTETFDAIIGEFMFSNLYSAFNSYGNWDIVAKTNIDDIKEIGTKTKTVGSETVENIENITQFGAVFQCPFIWFSTIEPHFSITNVVDGPLNPAYSSDYLNARIPPYSFLERAHELWHQAVALYRQSYTFHNIEEKIYLELIAPVIKAQGRPVPAYEDLKYNASLVLGNSQVVLGAAISLPACYKHIGGYHIDEEVKPLPEDLKKLIDNAKNGVIYFSMGSNLKSKDLPDELKQGLLKIFSTIKQTVIWKFEEVLPNVPRNVHIVQWAPQQSILAHKNVVLFITHGGLLSITEAVHFGVPLIAIPVFGDQPQNAKLVERKGLGKHVPLTYNLVEYLKDALDEVLHNPKYALKAKELSVALRDRQQTPAEELNFWVQHVVRTRGAPHLRSPAVTLPIYQRAYLDLIVITFVLLLVVIFIIKKILCRLNMTSNIKQKIN